MNNHNIVSYKNVRINGGFWKKWQSTAINSTIDAVYTQFTDSGRFDAMTHSWREGEPNKPHIFYDSDAAKWIEGAAYSLVIKKDKELEDKIDALVNLIEDGMSSEGYFNSYYQTIEPQNRWTLRPNHELYCAGHLIEAAVAYYEATGKVKFLELMCRYADYIEEIFVEQKSAKFYTPGHEEIELALVRLYHATGEKKYLELAKHFIDERGKHGENCFESFFGRELSYSQDQAPVAEQQSAEGHVVRFGYLFSAACDIAREYGDEKLLEACKRVFFNAIQKKMYVTGGVGNLRHGEAFGPEYFLPNFDAYTETCASIAFAFMAQRLLRIECDSRYADNLELQIYNGALAGISDDGDKFFYENPLEQKPSDLEFMHRVRANGRPEERVKLFSCSCCPPNILRLLTNIGEYFYNTDGNTVYAHLYGSNSAKMKIANGNIKLTQTTQYPLNGKVSVKIGVDAPTNATLAFRVPGWCKAPSILFEGKEADKLEKGYAYFTREWKNGDTVELNFPMKVRMLEADPRVFADCGRVALKYGPLVYCVEEIDNGKNLNDIKIAKNPAFAVVKSEILGGLNMITFKGSVRASDFGDELYRDYEDEREEKIFTAIPYYAWNNRGIGEVAVWLLK